MRDRCHTVILVPHSRARLRKWQITPRQLKLVVAGVVAISLAAGGLLWSALRNAVDQGELAKLRQENQTLQDLRKSFESSLKRLEQQIETFDDRAAKLSIVAGIDAEAGGDRAGIGGEVIGDIDQYEAYLQALEARSLSIEGRLDQVETLLDERSLMVSSTPSIAPVRGIYTSGFGYRRDPVTGRREFHPGLDIAAPAGHPVLAPADGIVLKSGVQGGLGRAAFVSHGFGLITGYGHMSRIAVEGGQKVRRGDVIGYVGTTGRSTGYHLHYEVHVDGKPVDPLSFILDAR